MAQKLKLFIVYTPNDIKVIETFNNRLEATKFASELEYTTNILCKSIFKNKYSSTFLKYYDKIH